MERRAVGPMQSQCCRRRAQLTAEQARARSASCARERQLLLRTALDNWARRRREACERRRARTSSASSSWACQPDRLEAEEEDEREQRPPPASVAALVICISSDSDSDSSDDEDDGLRPAAAARTDRPSSCGSSEAGVPTQAAEPALAS
ncbi:uncharacterized protein LOC126284953 [Schistocerca gregaria]|uniref:uncharacterized protein LOC126284953 n=1 Tax=Schistocerca gregaria TaxID=7010 RepID=UPI00211EA0C3|nr:uncharacterized protein LOC126284953 [Schistocerca gregaria]